MAQKKVFNQFMKRKRKKSFRQRAGRKGNHALAEVHEISDPFVLRPSQSHLHVANRVFLRSKSWSDQPGKWICIRRDRKNQTRMCNVRDVSILSGLRFMKECRYGPRQSKSATYIEKGKINVEVKFTPFSCKRRRAPMRVSSRLQNSAGPR